MNKKDIERIKSAVIVVLFFTTILLLYLVLGGSSSMKLSDILSIGARGASAPNAAEVIMPEYAAYSAGDRSFSLAFGGEGKDSSLTTKKALASEGLEAFMSIAKQGAMLASEIPGEQYLSAFTDYESILYSYSYTIPFADFCEVFGIKLSGTMSNIDGISAFGFSSGAYGSVLLADSQKDKYYRLLSDSASAGEESDNPLPGSNAVFSNEKYYFAEDVLGAGGQRLIPIGQAKALSLASFELEIDTANEDARFEIAKKVFGDTIDFVRRIEDGFGNYTYMYGYGSKTLTLTANGGLEFKTESSARRSGGWAKDLEVALEYIESVGGWDTKDDSYFELSDVSASNESGKTIRSFEFSQFVKGAEIFTGRGGHAITVTIENGKPIYYSRNAIKVSFSGNEASWIPMDAVNTIAANSSTQDNFNYVAENYESIKKSYLAFDGTLRPVWRLIINDGTTAYYDLYTGDALLESGLVLEEKD